MPIQKFYTYIKKVVKTFKWVFHFLGFLEFISAKNAIEREGTSSQPVCYDHHRNSCFWEITICFATSVLESDKKLPKCCSSQGQDHTLCRRGIATTEGVLSEIVSVAFISINVHIQWAIREPQIWDWMSSFVHVPAKLIYIQNSLGIICISRKIFLLNRRQNISYTDFLIHIIIPSMIVKSWLG